MQACKKVVSCRSTPFNAESNPNLYGPQPPPAAIDTLEVDDKYLYTENLRDVSPPRWLLCRHRHRPAQLEDNL